MVTDELLQQSLTVTLLFKRYTGDFLQATSYLQVTSNLQYFLKPEVGSKLKS